MEPKGRGGWLRFFIFILIASTLAILVKGMGPILIAEQEGAVWPPGFKPTYTLSLLIPAGFLGFAAWTLIKHSTWQTVNTAIRCMWIGSITSLLAPALVVSMFMPNVDVWSAVLPSATGSCISLVIWTFYLLKSKRVRNTYPIGAPGFIQKSKVKESTLQDIFSSPPPARSIDSPVETSKPGTSPFEHPSKD
ncbi:DUF2569 family protein [Comamonas sp. MYb21]|uniref:DUF2569 family protein n=1 Tax=Comamonas sp. MYb21 TaxID=1848648 RepID=UPI003098A64A